MEEVPQLENGMTVCIDCLVAMYGSLGKGVVDKFEATMKKNEGLEDASK